MDPQLALDRLDARTLVANDDDVVDEHLRPLAHRHAHVGARVVLGERDRRLDDRTLITPVQVLELNAVAVGDHLHLGIRLPGRRRHHRPDLGVAEHHIPLNGDGSNDRPRTFGHVERDQHAAITIRP